MKTKTTQGKLLAIVAAKTLFQQIRIESIKQFKSDKMPAYVAEYIDSKFNEVLAIIENDEKETFAELINETSDLLHDAESGGGYGAN